MNTEHNNKRITLAWTGASGAPYGMRLLQVLLAADYEVFLLISSAAKVVLATEHGIKLSANEERAKQTLTTELGVATSKLHICGKDDWFSAVASGSAAPRQMVVCPCSMGSLAAIAHGMSNNLLERAADVVLKERGQLLLVVRETPLSSIHLENMLKVTQAGATIMPAAPGFYHRPNTVDDLIDFMVARILDHLGIEQQLQPRWGYQHK